MKNNTVTYLSREFRDNLSNAFQDVLEGRTIIIKRFNREFILMSAQARKKEIEAVDKLEKRVEKLEKHLVAPPKVSNVGDTTPMT